MGEIMVKDSFFDIIQGDGSDRIILSEIDIDDLRRWIDEIENLESDVPIQQYQELIGKIVHGYPNRIVKLTAIEFHRARDLLHKPHFSPHGGPLRSF